MNKEKYYDTDELYFSYIYSNRIYKEIDEHVSDPISGGVNYIGQFVNNFSVLIENIGSKSEDSCSYFLKRFDECEDSIDKYIYLIMNPPLTDCILWPVDIVRLNETQRSKNTLYVSNSYSYVLNDKQEDKGQYALVFPYEGNIHDSNLNSVISQLYQSEAEIIHLVNHRQTKIRKLAYDVVNAIDDINKQGYAYLDMHLSRLYTRGKNQIFFDFSNLIYPLKSFYQKNDKTANIINIHRYPLEYLSPNIASQNLLKITFDEQNYSIAALLFYMFFGKRFPLEGSLVHGSGIDKIGNYAAYLNFLLTEPGIQFIYSDDNSNPNILSEDEGEFLNELWEELPESLKELFVYTLSTKPKQVNNKTLVLLKNSSLPTASIWKKSFENLNWNKI